MNGVDYYFATSDTRPIIEETLEDADSLKGASVTFTMKAVDGQSTVTVDAQTATIENASDGIVSYQLSASDTAAEGEFFGEFNVTYSDGSIESFPKGRFYFIEIRDSL